MPVTEISDEPSVYQRLQKRLLSGEIAPGTRLTERRLARELGVSTIPVRESIRRMVAEGLLVGGKKWEGVRTRVYSSDEVRHLIELRESLEGGAAQAAAANATEGDLARMDVICDEFEMDLNRLSTIGDEAEEECSGYRAEDWAQLEQRFHMALAEASHNERLICILKHLLAECYYVFFIHPNRARSRKLTRKEAVTSVASATGDHRTLVELIRAGDADLAGRLARAHISSTAGESGRERMASDLKR
jgi:DNA-binding GntR family transcriptional regulator